MNKNAKEISKNTAVFSLEHDGEPVEISDEMRIKMLDILKGGLTKSGDLKTGDTIDIKIFKEGTVIFQTNKA